MVVGVAGLLGLFSACGGNDRAGVLPDGTGGTGRGGARPAAGSSSKAGNGADGGMGGAGEESPSNAPLVDIISPTESLSPDDGVIVVTSVGLGARWSVPGANPARAWPWRWMRRAVRS